MEKIRVLEIIGDASLFGGAVSFLSLVKGLNKKRFQVFCICPPGPLFLRLKKIPEVESQAVVMRSGFDLQAVKEIRRIVDGFAPDIVHTHGTRGGWLGRLACIMERDYAPQVIYTEHLWTEEYKLDNPLTHFLQLSGLYFLELFTNCTVAVSQAVADFLIRHNICRPEKVVVIYNGVKIPKITKRKRAESKEKVIGFVGSLTKRKGVNYLLQAVAELKEGVRLVLVGDGPEKERLLALTKRLKIDKMVSFEGLVDDPFQYYPTFDIYVQPSLDEAFGIATLEAMASGRPVITSWVGGLVELLGFSLDKIKNQGRKKAYLLAPYGFLVPPANPKALAEAMRRLLKDEQLALKLGERAKERAKEFSVERMVSETENLYLALAD